MSTPSGPSSPSGGPGSWAWAGWPPAGWYADPAGSGGLRWWDGSSWTPYTAPPPVITPSPGELVQKERRLTGWATAAVVAYVAVGAVSALLTVLYLSRWQLDGHQLRVIWNDVLNGRRPPRFRTGPVNAWLGLLGLVNIPATVLVLVWQFRAAVAARSLGYPARWSPGWGVGCWFVPVVDLWMPYQAIRDTLPPGDRHRRRVLMMWLLFTWTWLLNGVFGIVVLFLGGGWITAWSITRLLAFAALAVAGIPLVGNITRRHEKALAVPDSSSPPTVPVRPGGR